MPKTVRLRWVFGIWLISTLILSSSFTANLQTFLNFDSYEKQISTTEDIMEAGLDIGYDSLFAFAHSDVPEDKYILSRGEMCDTSGYCLRRAAFERKMAVIKIRRNALFMRRRNYSSDEGFLLHICKKGMQNVLMQFVLTRGYPMADQLNAQTIRIMQAGFVKYYVARFEYLMSISYGRMGNSMSSNSLSLDELIVPFLIWGIGMLVSLAVFVIETRFHRKSDRAKRA